MEETAVDNSFLHVIGSPWFLSAFCGWCVAQLVKFITNIFRNHTVDFSYMVSTGGMPSAHSSMASALAVSVGITEGFATPVFVIALAFASVTMYDAAGIRNAAGQQAKILNLIVDELVQEHTFNIPRLKELLGHTRLEVFAGMVTGIIVALIICIWVSGIEIFAS